MNPNIQSEKNMPKNFAAGATNFNPADIKTELKTVAEQLEAVSKKIKTQYPDSDWQSLQAMCSEVEHFLDSESRTEPGRNQSVRDESESSTGGIYGKSVNPKDKSALS